MVRSIIVEVKKAMFDKGIILTSIAFFLINLINLLDEIRLHSTYTSSSVLYFWINRHGLGGITILLFLLCGIPYGIQFSLEKHNESWKYYLIRERFEGYVFSKIVVTVITSIVSFWGGYLLLFLYLRSKYMLYPDDTVFFVQMVDGLPFAKLALQENIAFFLLSIIPEIMMMTFMASLSLLVATWTDNKYVVISSPMIVYYGWNYFTGTFDLPDVFWWTLKILEGFTYFENDVANCLFTVGYYFVGIAVIGCVFFKRCKGDIENV